MSNVFSRRGRRKSDPIWNNFIDGRANGVEEITCRRCSFKVVARHTAFLKSHMRKRHPEVPIEETPPRAIRSAFDHANFESNGLLLSQNGGSTAMNGYSTTSTAISRIMDEISKKGSARVDQNEIIRLLTTIGSGGGSSGASGGSSALSTGLNTDSATTSPTATASVTPIVNGHLNSVLHNALHPPSNQNYLPPSEFTSGSAVYIKPDPCPPSPSSQTSWHLVGIYSTDSDLETAIQNIKVSPVVQGGSDEERASPSIAGSKTSYRCSHASDEGHSCSYAACSIRSDTDNGIRLYRNSEGCPMAAEKDENGKTLNGSEEEQDKRFVTVDGVRIKTELEPIIEEESTPPESTTPTETPNQTPLDGPATACLVLPDNLLNVLHTAAASVNGAWNGNGVFNLSSGQCISGLLQIASEQSLVFMFDAKVGEYSLTNQIVDKAIVFVDNGPQVIVRDVVNKSIVNSEIWVKSDWSQFVWAIRGKCSSLFGSVAR